MESPKDLNDWELFIWGVQCYPLRLTSIFKTVSSVFLVGWDKNVGWRSWKTLTVCEVQIVSTLSWGDWVNMAFAPKLANAWVKQSIQLSLSQVVHIVQTRQKKVYRYFPLISWWVTKKRMGRTRALQSINPFLGVCQHPSFTWAILSCGIF